MLQQVHRRTVRRSCCFSVMSTSCYAIFIAIAINSFWMTFSSQLRKLRSSGIVRERRHHEDFCSAFLKKSVCPSVGWTKTHEPMLQFGA